jgi:transposase
MRYARATSTRSGFDADRKRSTRSGTACIQPQQAAYEPSVIVALVLSAFATNVRSSRAIERHCRQDVAYRVIGGNLVPDHATITRFICRQERALAGLFTEVLKLCAQAGLVGPGVVSIDGTRIAGNASPEVNYEFARIAREIVAEAKATDEAEDQLYGEERVMSRPSSCARRRDGASSSATPASRCGASGGALRRPLSRRRG